MKVLIVYHTLDYTQKCIVSSLMELLKNAECIDAAYFSSYASVDKRKFFGIFDDPNFVPYKGLNVAMIKQQRLVLNVYKYLREHGIDTVVCTQQKAARLMLAVKDSFYPELRFFVMSEHFAPPRAYFNMNYDGVFVPFDNIKRRFVFNSVPEHKIISCCFPVPKMYMSPLDKSEIRKRCHIDSSWHFALLLAHDCSFDFVKNYVDNLLENCKFPFLIIVFAFGNKNLSQRVNEYFFHLKRVRAYVGDEDMLFKLICACDVVLTPSQNALVAKIGFVKRPIIFTCTSEDNNTEMKRLVNMSVGICGIDPKDAVCAFKSFYQNPSTQNIVMLNQMYNFKDKHQLIYDIIYNNRNEENK